MNTLTRLYIGHNVDGEPTHSHFDIVSTASRILRDHSYDGATFIEATGMWKGEFEMCTIIEIAHEDPPSFHQTLARALGEQFNQEEILLVHQRVSTDFVDAVKG